MGGMGIIMCWEIHYCTLTLLVLPPISIIRQQVDTWAKMTTKKMTILELPTFIRLKTCKLYQGMKTTLHGLIK